METGAVYSFESLRERLERKIADILSATGGDSYLIFLTGKGNFRESIAVTAEYKGNRIAEKPYHYHNTRVYLESLGAIVVNGMEADDAMAIEATKDVNTIICTRDKDLRQVPGWHYGWEAGLQPEYQLRYVDELGELELIEKKSGKEITGTGLKFFYSQMITGDVTDNIKGLKGGGAVLAYRLLNTCTNESELYVATRGAYLARAKKDNPDASDADINSLVDTSMLEQGRLLWMVRDLDAEGRPIMWEPPIGREDSQ